jgi:hypothetical protein
MTAAVSHASRLSIEDMDAILGVTRALAAPFDLRAMLAEVTRAACLVLRAERASVWLHDAPARQLNVEQVRVDVGTGLVGGLRARPAADQRARLLGLLEPLTHRLRMLSGGQGPMLHYRAAERACVAHRATWLPLGTLPLESPRPAIELDMAPGDWLVLLSDGVFECAAQGGELFGRARVEDLVAAAAEVSPPVLADRLLAAVQAHRAGNAQDDDITMVLLKRSGDVR